MRERVVLSCITTLVAWTVPQIVMAQPPRADTLRVKTVVVKDDALFKMDAFRTLAPVDWTVRGNVHWRTHPILPATASLSARNPAAREAVYFYPHYPFADGVREMLIRRAGIAGPEVVAMINREYGEGAFYFGNEVRRQATEPAEYLTRILLPRERPDIKDYRIVETQLLPEWAKSSVTVATMSRELPTRAWAARLRLEYPAGPQLIQEDFYIMTTEVVLAEVRYWGAETASSALAEKGKLEPVVRIHNAMLHSFKIELPWYNRVAQVAELLQEGIRRHAKMIGEFSDYLSRTREEISRVNREAYEARMKSQDRLAEKFSEYIRGVESYVDPHKAIPVELPAGYDHVWATPLGDYILTNDSLYDPNLTVHGTWSRLKRKN